MFALLLKSTLFVLDALTFVFKSFTNPLSKFDPCDSSPKIYLASHKSFTRSSRLGKRVSTSIDQEISGGRDLILKRAKDSVV